MSTYPAPTETKQKSNNQFLMLAGILVLLLLVIVGTLALNSHSGSATEAEDADRAAVRVKNLTDLQAADTAQLTSYGWNDKAKGIVHIPITNAMQLVLPALNARAQISTQQ